MTPVDLDADGDLDLVGLFNGNHLRWFENTDGLGTFGSAQPIATLSGDVEHYILVDKDLDGDLDVVIHLEDEDHLLLIEGLGNALFGAPEALNSYGSEPEKFALADLTGDGYPEIVATLTLGAGGGISWHANVDGTFATSTDLPDLHPGSASTLLLLGDMDLVGGIDIVLKDGDGNLVGMRNEAGDTSVWTVMELLN